MPSFALKDYTRYNHSELALLPNLEERRMPQGFAIMTLKKGQRLTVDHLLGQDPASSLSPSPHISHYTP
jgi:hypothetical protein